MSDILNRREALAALSLSALPAVAGAADKPEEKPAAPIPANALVVVVMDPLAAPLSCPCVKGYAQRDYDKLGKYLETKLGRAVAVVYAETLAGALTKKTNGKADLIIGKDSVVRATAPEHKVTVTHLAALAGKDGKTTQTGLICVAAADKAVTPADLKGYTVYFGTADAEEKNGAAVQVLTDFGIALPAKLETCVACTDGATKVIEEAKGGKKVATVISSYAQPLLEGCGTIKKGDLRVIGETAPVAFVAAFATGTLSPGDRDTVKAALLALGTNKDLCAALETKGGFVAPPTKKK
ncbi:MAG TPA: PhnD/SsuA/transferrin family substrate-binding protein [Gemmata sp.]